MRHPLKCPAVSAIDARRGGWIVTASGAKFWPLAPRPEEVNLFDIAAALSMTCRYRGHTSRFYSVAQHSMLVARHVAPENRLWALLHDAPEAYLCDLAAPIRDAFPEVMAAEKRLMAVICDAFGLPREMPAEVARVDREILGDEWRALMPSGVPGLEMPAGLGCFIAEMPDWKARSMFAAACRDEIARLNAEAA